MKRKRIKRLIDFYEERRQYWQSRADYYFKNHSYYLGCLEIEEEYEPHFKLACENRNVFYDKAENLKSKLLINKIKRWLN